MPKKFSMNKNAVQQLADQVEKKLQGDLNAKVQKVVREVNESMQGRDEDEIFVELRSRIVDRIPGIEVNEPSLRKYAAAISAGTLR